MSARDLEAELWNCAQILRGSAVARTDWKAYIVPLLFFKRISDVWDEETAAAIDTYGEADAAAFPEEHLAQVSDLRAFENVFRLAAARTASELNLNSLASDAGISQQTARRWLSAQEVGYLATTLPPHFLNFRKRMRKRPRLHFLDSRLVCQLFGIRDGATLERHPLRGAVFESFVVGELVKAFTAMRHDPPLFFWRDATGHEIDVLMDGGERLIPVEVKSGHTVSPDAIGGLEWWTSLPGNPNRGGVLVHGGDDSCSLKGFRVAPWFLAAGPS